VGFWGVERAFCFHSTPALLKVVILEAQLPVADLTPIPFETLVHRLDRELVDAKALYEMPRREWWVPQAHVDVSCTHLGKKIATPAGPASGPHTQMAQNLVLSFLGGGRFMELKTVQVNDTLEIPRPCIFVPHIGYNVEWSQELRVPQSAGEYVKGWMLIHMLCSQHGPGLWPAVDTTFDISLGYDLAGIQTDKVQQYLHAMWDASSLIAKYRAELPPRLKKWADVSVPNRVGNSITLSTFHGCPAEEIEAIATQTLDWGWHTVVKLNPTLLGYARVRSMMDAMGYSFVALDPTAFEKDLQWEQLMDMVPRLQAKAAEKGLGLGFKLSNTLVCHSPRTPFYPESKGQGEMYLSGPPLHVIAMTLAQQLRESVGVSVPLTFSAGVDKENFARCVGGGLGPVTSCSDLLKGRGYGRMTHYVRALEKEMVAQGAATLAGFRQSLAPAASTVEQAGAEHLATVTAGILTDSRYHSESNEKAPKKRGTDLALLDCLTCDKCIPVCPNNANFTLGVAAGEHETQWIQWGENGLNLTEGSTLVVSKRHQIGTLADLCNSCGQCDPWCPEDGGPYLVKANLFLSRQAFEEQPDRHGFYLSKDRSRLEWRRQDGAVFALVHDPAGERLETPEGSLRFEGDTVVAHVGAGAVDTHVLKTLRLYKAAFVAEERPSWLPPVQ
jgi:putative selenate reductase